MTLTGMLTGPNFYALGLDDEAAFQAAILSYFDALTANATASAVAT